MTLHIVDVSRHQVERPDPLNLEDARNVGMGAVNIQLDRGRQEDVLPTWARAYADRARHLGMGISTYRWLDNRIPGAESARRAYERMQLLGGPDGMAHVVDCEDDATEQTLRDYVTTMTALLGRPIAIYSGRWWLQPRGWQVADLSPYLWAAPSVGYLGTYPGDNSPDWSVAYGGWTTLAAMQYAVVPLPGTGLCSLSAIREPTVWATLTGGGRVPLKPDSRITAEHARFINAVAALDPGDTGALSPYVKQAGYHGTRDDQYALGRSNDYSVRTADDKAGPSDKTAAFDWISESARLRGDHTVMYRYAARIRDAYNRRDPRLRGWREWLTYLDGKLIGFDFVDWYTRTPGASHDMHHHMSKVRRYTTDWPSYAAMLSILAGEPLTVWQAGISRYQERKDTDMQPVLIKFPTGPVVLVTMGQGHLVMDTDEELVSTQEFMASNNMGTRVWDWPEKYRPLAGPNLEQQPAAVVDVAALAALVVDGLAEQGLLTASKVAAAHTAAAAALRD
jgi:hypothetical protein